MSIQLLPIKSYHQRLIPNLANIFIYLNIEFCIKVRYENKSQTHNSQKHTLYNSLQILKL